MNVISGFLSMLLDVSSKRKQGRDIDMPTMKECTELLDLHNKTREMYDLPPLKMNDNCALVAQSHATWMSSAHALSHLGFSFFGPSQRLSIVGEDPSNIGECISFSIYDDASSLMKAWFKSETHRSVILGNYSHFGVGRVLSKDGYNYWCAIYMDGGRSNESPKLNLSDSLIDVDNI